jgi:hypothetical protein
VKTKLAIFVSITMVLGVGCGRATVETGGAERRATPGEDSGGDVDGLPVETPSNADDEGQAVPVDGEDVEPNAEAFGCPVLFEMDVHAHWLSISGERYYVDDVGRPAGAITWLPTEETITERDQDCQGQVGRWGDAANLGADYDGGHLIGFQLGGWGSRANLVPQVANFNRGNWAQVENAIARCGDLQDGQLTMEVSVVYADSLTLVPSSMGMALTDSGSGTSISVQFANAPQGGFAGTEERVRAVDWLRAIGCE